MEEYGQAWNGGETDFQRSSAGACAKLPAAPAATYGVLFAHHKAKLDEEAGVRIDARRHTRSVRRSESAKRGKRVGVVTQALDDDATDSSDERRTPVRSAKEDGIMEAARRPPSHSTVGSYPRPLRGDG
eukprot:gene1358-biopygen10786